MKVGKPPALLSPCVVQCRQMYPLIRVRSSRQLTCVARKSPKLLCLHLFKVTLRVTPRPAQLNRLRTSAHSLRLPITGFLSTSNICAARNSFSVVSLSSLSCRRADLQNKNLTTRSSAEKPCVELKTLSERLFSYWVRPISLFRYTVCRPVWASNHA